MNDALYFLKKNASDVGFPCNDVKIYPAGPGFIMLKSMCHLIILYIFSIHKIFILQLQLQLDQQYRLNTFIKTSPKTIFDHLLISYWIGATLIFICRLSDFGFRQSQANEQYSFPVPSE